MSSGPSAGAVVHRRFLAFTALNSFSSGVATLGIFFLTKTAFQFSDVENFALGVLLGITYIVGSLAAGRVIRALEARFPSITPRRILVGIVALLAIDVAMPALLGDAAGRVAIWFSITFYSLLTGGLWPLVESYQTGGLRGNALRGMVARFNVTWSSANAIAMWTIAPYVEKQPLLVLIGLGVIHLLSLPLLRGMPNRPARHETEHEPHPASYAALLAMHRVLLAAAYVVMYAITPYLPTLCERLHVVTAWATPLASTWMIVRVLTFVLLSRWQKWHGRVATAVVGGFLLLCGFGLAVLAPTLAAGSDSLGILLLGGGLACFGVGIATLYNAALYYALAVGSAEVDAGGTHEALIGVGYTLGPLCGLIAVGLERGGAISGASRDPTTLGLVAVVFGTAAMIARRSARRAETREATARATELPGGRTASTETSTLR